MDNGPSDTWQRAYYQHLLFTLEITGTDCSNLIRANFSISLSKIVVRDASATPAHVCEHDLPQKLRQNTLFLSLSTFGIYCSNIFVNYQQTVNSEVQSVNFEQYSRG